jgi:deoxyribose-phosphate aldolase
MCPAVRLAPFIDHTFLAPEAVEADIDRVCGEALGHGVAAVCVNPVWVRRCAARLAGSRVVVASVVGFPFGATDTAIKAAEAALAVEHGARELDMVVALGALKGGDWRFVERDIAATVAAGHGAVVKVIIESALLSDAEIVRACEVARNAGAGYVKTSTGYHGSGGATVAAVRLMRRTVGDDLGVKASGGIRDCAGATAMFAAGATRIGTSRGAVLAECLGPGPRPLAELPALSHEGAPTAAGVAP